MSKAISNVLGYIVSMEHQKILQTIAEIAIGLIGFTGIVSALGRRRDWDRTEIRNFMVILRACISALLLSFLPYLLGSIFQRKHCGDCPAGQSAR